MTSAYLQATSDEEDYFSRPTRQSFALKRNDHNILNKLQRGSERNFYIERKAGISDIFCVPIKTRGNASVVRSRPMMAFYLRETSDARPHQVSEFIFRDYERKTGPIRKHVRPWTNDTHITDKYINKLRELVQIGFSQELANSCYTIVIFLRLLFISFFIDDQCTEF